VVPPHISLIKKRSIQVQSYFSDITVTPVVLYFIQELSHESIHQIICCIFTPTIYSLKTNW